MSGTYSNPSVVIGEHICQGNYRLRCLTCHEAQQVGCCRSGISLVEEFSQFWHRGRSKHAASFYCSVLAVTRGGEMDFNELLLVEQLDEFLLQARVLGLPHFDEPSHRITSEVPQGVFRRFMFFHCLTC